MAFSLTDDEQLIQRTVAELAASIGLEAASELDRYDRFPTEQLQQVGGLGLLGVAGPAEAGGAGATAYALTVYELAKVCPNTAAVTVAHNGCLRIASDAGSGLLGQLAAGEICALQSTEEATGCAKGEFGTTATPTDDGWILDGQKVWGVASSGATHYLVQAQTPDGPTLFRVDPKAEGISLGQNEPLMGMRAAGIRTVYLNQVAVSSDALVGEVGGGLELELAARPWVQLGVAAAILGAIAGAKEAADRFAESRVQFQKPIGTFQAVSDGVVRMDTNLAAGRALMLEAAANLEGSHAALWAARAKEFAQEIAIPMTRQAIRVQGGTGFMREGGTERFARDVRALQFMGEPFAVQRRTIRDAILDLPVEA